MTKRMWIICGLALITLALTSPDAMARPRGGGQGPAAGGPHAMARQAATPARRCGTGPQRPFGPPPTSINGTDGADGARTRSASYGGNGQTTLQGIPVQRDMEIPSKKQKNPG